MKKDNRIIENDQITQIWSIGHCLKHYLTCNGIFLHKFSLICRLQALCNSYTGIVGVYRSQNAQFGINLGQNAWKKDKIDNIDRNNPFYWFKVH